MKRSLFRNQKFKTGLFEIPPAGGPAASPLPEAEEADGFVEKGQESPDSAAADGTTGGPLVPGGESTSGGEPASPAGTGTSPRPATGGTTTGTAPTAGAATQTGAPTGTAGAATVAPTADNPLGLTGNDLVAYRAAQEQSDGYAILGGSEETQRLFNEVRGAPSGSSAAAGSVQVPTKAQVQAAAPRYPAPQSLKMYQELDAEKKPTGNLQVAPAVHDRTGLGYDNDTNHFTMPEGQDIDARYISGYLTGTEGMTRREADLYIDEARRQAGPDASNLEILNATHDLATEGLSYSYDRPDLYLEGFDSSSEDVAYRDAQMKQLEELLPRDPSQQWDFLRGAREAGMTTEQMIQSLQGGGVSGDPQAVADQAFRKTNPETGQPIYQDPEGQIEARQQARAKHAADAQTAHDNLALHPSAKQIAANEEEIAQNEAALAAVPGILAENEEIVGDMVDRAVAAEPGSEEWTTLKDNLDSPKAQEIATYIEANRAALTDDAEGPEDARLEELKQELVAEQQETITAEATRRRERNTELAAENKELAKTKAEITIDGKTKAVSYDELRKAADAADRKVENFDRRVADAASNLNTPALGLLTHPENNGLTADGRRMRGQNVVDTLTNWNNTAGQGTTLLGQPAAAVGTVGGFLNGIHGIETAAESIGKTGRRDGLMGKSDEMAAIWRNKIGDTTRRDGLGDKFKFEEPPEASKGAEALATAAGRTRDERRKAFNVSMQRQKDAEEVNTAADEGERALAQQHVEDSQGTPKRSKRYRPRYV